MEALWIALAAALVGAGVGSLATWLVARDRFRNETDWDRRQLLREKLEEIGGLADQLNFEHRGFIGQLMLMVSEGSKPLELLTGTGPIRLPIARLTLLIAFYAPELRPKLDAVIAARDMLGVDELDAVLLARSKTVFPRLLDAMGAMNKACEDLANSAAESARKRYGLSGDFD